MGSESEKFDIADYASTRARQALSDSGKYKFLTTPSFAQVRAACIQQGWNMTNSGDFTTAAVQVAHEQEDSLCLQLHAIWTYGRDVCGDLGISHGESSNREFYQSTMHHSSWTRTERMSLNGCH